MKVVILKQRLQSKIKQRAAKDSPRDTLDTDSLTDRSSSPTIIGSNAFVGRPPPLDSKTERDLRQACALILQDLKPSGHDIEDTRMKSDILIDEDPDVDPYNFNHGLVPAPVAQKQVEHPLRSHSAADWIRQDENNNSRLKPSSALKTTVTPAPKLLASQKSSMVTEPTKSSYSRPKSTTLPPRTTRIILSESPLAPTQTLASSTIPASSPRPITQADSPTTSPSTQYTSASSDRNKSVSTATPFTPSLSSKRVSENDKTQIQPSPALGGQWMKGSVDRRRQADVDTTAGASGPVNGSINATIVPQPGVKSPTLQNFEMMDITNARTMSLKSHPISDGMSSPPINTRSSSSYSNRMSVDPSPPPGGAIAGGASYHPPVARSVNIPNRRSSRADARLSTDVAIREKDRSPPAASPESKDVPPVPRLEAGRVDSFAKRLSFPAEQLSADAVPIEPQTPKDDDTRMIRQQLNNVQSSEAFPAPSAAAAPTSANPSSSYSIDPNSSAPVQQFATHAPVAKSNIPLSTAAVRASTSQWPMSTFSDPTASPPPTAGSQPPKSPLKHQQDPSIVVKDFYRPTPPPTNANTTPAPAPNSRSDGPTPVRDPRPEDLDYLMSVMNYTRESIYSADTPPPSSKSERHPVALQNQVSLQGDSSATQNGTANMPPVARPVPEFRPVSPLPPGTSLSVPGARSASNDISPIQSAASTPRPPSHRPKPEPYTRSNDNFAQLREFAATAPPSYLTKKTLHTNNPAGRANMSSSNASSVAPRRNTMHAPTDSDSSTFNPTAPLPLPTASNADSPNYLSTPPAEPVTTIPARSRTRSKTLTKSGSKDPSNGLSKLLHRLGGGNMPPPPPPSATNNKRSSSRSSTATSTAGKRTSTTQDPSAYTYANGNLYNYERLGSLGGNRWMETAEYWDDDEDGGGGEGGRACAAPVVGFGRGR